MARTADAAVTMTTPRDQQDGGREEDLVQTELRAI